jgi:hypothetical protein
MSSYNNNFIISVFDIFFIKYFGDKFKFINTFINDFNSINAVNKDCGWMLNLFYYIILLIYFIAIIWIVCDVIIKNYYLSNAYIGMSFKDKLIFSDIPEFNQIKNLIYINDNFSFDIHFIIFLSLLIITVAIFYYFNYFKKYDNFFTEFNLIIPLFVISIIIGVIYFITNFKNTALLSSRVNILKTFIYDNINISFINNKKLCNYLDKKNILDDFFVYGKCNNIKYLFTQDKLYSYITDIINEIHNTTTTDNNIDLDKFLTLKDKSGIFYKDRLVSAFFTFNFIRYYIDNNLLDEAKEFFSTYNIIKSIFNSRINPILNFNYDSILFNSTDLSYNIPSMQNAFNHNKKIYYYIYNEFYNTNTNIQEMIIDIYNFCKFKILCIYYYYLIIAIMMIFMIIYYFTKNYYNI